MNTLNHTHAPEARSWLASANAPDCDFPIQNLPFAVLRPAGTQQAFRGAVAIGDQALDLAALAQTGLLPPAAQAAAQAGAQERLNALMALGPNAWSALRHALFALLHQASAAEQAALRECLIPNRRVEVRLHVTR